jgi:hypothetical protein
VRALAHLAWIPAGALAGFAASFVFGDVLTLPVDLYYLSYFAVVLGFLALYAVRTGLRLRPWLSRRAAWSVAAGVAVGLVMVQNVLSRPGTERLAGGLLVWAVLWRGLVYGAVDGLLLSAFPWIVCWRALGAEENGLGRRLGAAALAWVAILVLTTAYHLGYRDFRSGMIVQPNVGSTIMSVPTLVTANPIGSPLTHVFLHVAAVVHSPRTELFLPPHR